MRRRKKQAELTPVDDVRRIRERLSREAGGDIGKLIERSRRAAEPYIKKLGLKVVPAPKRSPRRTGTLG